MFLNNYLIDIGIYSYYDYIYIEDSFIIDIITINGINIKYINASYPITDQVQQGYHTVIESNPTYIKIQLAQNSSKSTLLTETNTILDGNIGILIGVINSISTGYPNPDYYVYDLKKTY